jgi:Gnt-I system high-affinity gluconate transporter
MPLFIVILGIALLLVLILVVKINSFLAFVIVSLAVALAEGMALDKAITSIENGIGNTMGFLVLILGLGSMLGKLVSESGAAQRITIKLVGAFGLKHIQVLPSPPPCGWSTGFIATPLTVGRIPIQRFRPALPIETLIWS